MVDYSVKLLPGGAAGFVTLFSFALLFVEMVHKVSKIHRLSPELEKKTAALQGNLFFSPVCGGCGLPGPSVKYCCVLKQGIGNRGHP